MPDLPGPADCYRCGRHLTVKTGELWDDRPWCQDFIACDKRRARRQQQPRKDPR